MGSLVLGFRPPASQPDAERLVLRLSHAFLAPAVNLVWVPELLVSWHKPVAAPCLASVLLSPWCGCGKNRYFSTQCCDESGMRFPTQNRSLVLWSQDAAFPYDHERSRLCLEFTFFLEARGFPKENWRWEEAWSAQGFLISH